MENSYYKRQQLLAIALEILVSIFVFRCTCHTYRIYYLSVCVCDDKKFLPTSEISWSIIILHQCVSNVPSEVPYYKERKKESNTFISTFIH